jgi:hypothetical protein
VQNTEAEGHAQLDYYVKERGCNFIDTVQLLPHPQPLFHLRRHFFDSAQCLMARRWRLIGQFPILYNPPPPPRSRVLAAERVVDGWCDRRRRCTPCRRRMPAGCPGALRKSSARGW